MLINGINISDDDIVNSEDKFLKKYNNIYISEEQYNILKKYDIDAKKYNNVSEILVSESVFENCPERYSFFLLLLFFFLVLDKKKGYKVRCAEDEY